MNFISDLHIHSKYSMATSKFSEPPGLYKWAGIKGINVIGTGDITHPLYFKELKNYLTEDEDGFFQLKDEFKSSHDKELPEAENIKRRFCLSGEISSIYKKNGKCRKIHNIVYFPTFDAAVYFNNKLDKLGNIRSDGRPILGLDPKIILELLLESSHRAYMIPAHIWTPWFSLFGSKSGFDNINECFEDLTPHIFALETGLSSDPEMNWHLSQLDNYTLVSNSDAHSPQKLGREANLFNTDFTYDAMFQALKTGNGFDGTIEFFPEEGKYHMDGHRKCEISLDPEKSKELNNLCPVCGKALTLGVLNRVSELSDRKKAVKKKKAKDFDSIIPLPELISEIYGRGPGTKTVLKEYYNLISIFGSEFNILRKVPESDIKKAGYNILSLAINKMRKKQINPTPGFDGEFGIIKAFTKDELKELKIKNEQ